MARKSGDSKGWGRWARRPQGCTAVVAGQSPRADRQLFRSQALHTGSRSLDLARLPAIDLGCPLEKPPAGDYWICERLWTQEHAIATVFIRRFRIHLRYVGPRREFRFIEGRAKGTHHCVGGPIQCNDMACGPRTDPREPGTAQCDLITDVGSFCQPTLDAKRSRNRSVTNRPDHESHYKSRACHASLLLTQSH